MTTVVILASHALSASEVTRLSIQGVGPAGPILSALLVFLLAYLYIVEASERDRYRLQALLGAITVPLAVVFIAIIAYESLAIIGPL